MITLEPTGAACGAFVRGLDLSRPLDEAAMAELKLQELQGLLVRASDVRMQYARRLAALREAVLQVPARLAPVLAAEVDIARCHDTIQVELHGVLAVVSEA